MMRFNVRVELLGVTNIQDYEQLHARMLLNGYTPFIVGDDGRKWHLPPAEYVHVSDRQVRTVRDHAAAVVARGLRLGLNYRIYVVAFVDWASGNLVPAA